MNEDSADFDFADVLLSLKKNKSTDIYSDIPTFPPITGGTRCVSPATENSNPARIVLHNVSEDIHDIKNEKPIHKDHPTSSSNKNSSSAVKVGSVRDFQTMLQSDASYPLAEKSSFSIGENQTGVKNFMFGNSSGTLDAATTVQHLNSPTYEFQPAGVWSGVDFKAGRGKYKCSRCGVYKTNHICPLLEDQVMVCSVGTQMEPVISYIMNDQRVLHERTIKVGIWRG